MTRQYITTAIDFPNGAPHMGHAMEKILADVLARWYRLRGDEVRYQIGTDDHGINVQRTAESQGLHPRDLVKQNIPLFQTLFDTLNISYDVFMSTSVTEGHYETVQALWNALLENGHLEKRSYKGQYCSGCEKFVTSKDLVDGICPAHNRAPDEVEEENWFFLLTNKEEFLKKLVATDGDYKLIPEYRGNEVRTILENGLEDVSFSRQKANLYWGVPVPNDEDQVMYVWCDNLTNYISTLGYLTENQDSSWWDEATVTHVIGKDIARFHALNWPAMLHAGGVKTPDQLLIHGFITCEGQKMSKTIGNVVVPQEVIDRYGVDALRFYLSHEVPVGRDGDFSWERFGELYDAKLRNDLGNLLNRVLVLLKKEGGTLGTFGEPDFMTASADKYKDAMNNIEFSEALKEVMLLVSDANKYIDFSKPWEKEGDEKREILTKLAEALRHVSLALLPFTPETAQKIARQLNLPYAEEMLEKSFVLTDELTAWGGVTEWKEVGEPEILFAKIEDENS